MFLDRLEIPRKWIDWRDIFIATDNDYVFFFRCMFSDD